jgi:hypothetical protein
VDALADEQLDERRKETQLEIYTIKQQREDDKKHYLEGFDDRLREAKERIDETEKELIEHQEASAPPADDDTDAPEEEDSSAEESPVEKEDSLQDDERADEDKDPQEFVKEIEKKIDEMTKKS